MKHIKSLIALTAAIVIIAGCTQSQQTIAYKTLYSVEHVTVAAVDGYYLAVAKGQVSTNGVPFVSRMFNQFQTGYLLALDAAQFNTNALAPASLLQESTDLISFITTLKGVK